MKQKLKKENKGITLIALVITIVLLILAAVSIATLTGENGILTKAQDAKTETSAASVQETRDLWFSEKHMNEQLSTADTRTLEEVLNELENEELMTIEERSQIETQGYVRIASKNIVFIEEGIETKKFTVTSSKDEIKFENTINGGNIACEKPDFSTYTIEGISSNKDSGYVTTGNVTGKSGNLEIIGNIQEATFKYTLTSFMKGDEIFYIKVDIDGDKYYQELHVIQGDAVTYEEDFVAVVYDKKESTTTVIEKVENENFSNGSAMCITTKAGETLNPTITFDFYGSRVDTVSALLSVTSTITVVTRCGDGETVSNIPTIWDYSGVDVYNAIRKSLSFERDEYTYTTTCMSFGTEGYLYFWLDAVIVYK